MKALLVSDIFGVTTYFKQLKKILEPNVSGILSIDPYQGEEQDFEQEAQAYSAFLQRCGHEEYFIRLLAAVDRVQPDIVIGFSSGASAAWKLANDQQRSCKRIIGFYPSQIVHPAHEPFTSSTTIIFPTHEKIYDVNTAINTLEGVENLQIRSVDGHHGFINPTCSGYDKTLFQQGLRWIEQQLATLHEDAAGLVTK